MLFIESGSLTNSAGLANQLVQASQSRPGVTDTCGVYLTFMWVLGVHILVLMLEQSCALANVPSLQPPHFEFQVWHSLDYRQV